MRNNLFKIILFSITLSLLSVITFGCTFISPIVGKWQDIKGEETYEFTRTGDLINEYKWGINTGYYELIGDDIVKLNFDTPWGQYTLTDTWRYTITGNTMVLQAGNSTTTLYREGYTIFTTSNKSNTTIATNTTTIHLSEHKYNIGDKITKSSWTDRYLSIVDIEYKDGEWLYKTSSSTNEFITGYLSVTDLDNNSEFYLIN
jgi:hypothetical protein